MKLYESIEDFPVYNWFKCIETKDYSWCLVEKIEVKEDELYKLAICFENLYFQFLDRFGISDELNDILDIQNQIKVLEIDLKLGKKTAKIFLNIKKLELEDKLQSDKPKNTTHKVAIEKYLGFKIDLKSTSVLEYYEYLEDFKNNGRATD